AGQPAWSEPTPDPVVALVRQIVSRAGGVLRTGAELQAGLAALEPHRDHEAGLVGQLVLTSALRREESRGGHTRLDFPAPDEVAQHIEVATDSLALESVR
ncbi:MAG: hypothetical protein WBB78_01945, partial [Propionicimonas sp.]